MRKYIIFILLSVLFIPPIACGDNKNFIDINDPQHIYKILATDPNMITGDQFYQCEFAIMTGYSGSGGYSIDEPLIQWLKKAENAFKAKGIKLKDEYNRHFAFADSYLNKQMYDRAYEEFKNIKDQAGAEVSEWFMNNKDIENGALKIKEYPGKIPYITSETAKTENKDYLFVGYFKGPVYRYDKTKKNHALIYAPPSQYDWCGGLAFDGRNLIIKLRDDAGTLIFDNDRQEISQLRQAFTISKTQITVFFGPDFYDLDDVIIDNLRLSPDRAKIAFIVNDKSKEVFRNLGITNVDGSDKKLLIKGNVENFSWLNDSEIIFKISGEDKFKIINLDGAIKESNVRVDFSEDIKIPKTVKAKLEKFLESDFKPHYGELGGTVKYEIENYAVSPDETKIAFLIIGTDGHAEFYPAWYVCSYKGENITLIDTTQKDMSNNVVWLSNNEIKYVKDARLWKAVVR